MNLIKAENKRIAKAIEKINDQENERLREQLRRAERATAEPFYAPEYSRAHDSYRRESYHGQPGPRRLMEPRKEPYYRRSSFADLEHSRPDEYYREPMRAPRFAEQERTVREKREVEPVERYNIEPSRPVKSNRITDDRRQYARKKSNAGVNREEEEFDRQDETTHRRPIEDQPVRGARRPVESEANQRRPIEDQPVRGSQKQSSDRKPRKPKEPESDLSDY